MSVWDEPHQVIIWLPTRSGIPKADAFVEAAAAHVGYHQDRPSFDLTWKVYEKGVLVGTGSGISGADGVMYGDSSRGFTFGTFPVKADHTYDVAVDVGSGFDYLLPAAPSVEVGVATATASIGLAFGESFRKTLAWGVGTCGVVVLFTAMWFQRSRRAAQQTDAADEVRAGNENRGPRS